jgi:hypothetical protein
VQKLDANPGSDIWKEKSLGGVEASMSVLLRHSSYLFMNIHEYNNPHIQQNLYLFLKFKDFTNTFEVS